MVYSHEISPKAETDYEEQVKDIGFSEKVSLKLRVKHSVKMMEGGAVYSKSDRHVHLKVAERGMNNLDEEF